MLRTRADWLHMTCNKPRMAEMASLERVLNVKEAESQLSAGLEILKTLSNTHSFSQANASRSKSLCCTTRSTIATAWTSTSCTQGQSSKRWRSCHRALQRSRRSWGWFLPPCFLKAIAWMSFMTTQSHGGASKRGQRRATRWQAATNFEHEAGEVLKT